MSLTRVSAFLFLDAILDGDGVGVVSGAARRFTITILRGLRKLGIAVEIFCCFGASDCVSSMKVFAFRFLGVIVVLLDLTAVE